MSAINDAQDEIIRHTQYLVHEQERSQRAYENAQAAGFDLAEVVYRFLRDPEAVGTDTLAAAYGFFMAQHAGGFVQTPGGVS